MNGSRPDGAVLANPVGHKAQTVPRSPGGGPAALFPRARSLALGLQRANFQTRLLSRRRGQPGRSLVVNLDRPESYHGGAQQMSILETGAGKVACFLPDSEVIPRRIRSFLPRTR